MNVFLSASVPLPDRNPEFFASADVLAIRDAVKALTVQVARCGVLTFGGHPAITPLVSLVMKQGFPDKRGSFVLYQSEYFFRYFPKENDEFIDVRVTPNVNDDREASLALMRKTMLSETKFRAGFFIGGMEGIAEEHRLFTQMHPGVPTYPIASAGGAALSLYNAGQWDTSLLQELTYPTLFRKLLVD